MHESHYGRGKLDARHKIARSMLKPGVEIDIVMEDTGLTRKVVSKLKRALGSYSKLLLG